MYVVEDGTRLTVVDAGLPQYWDQLTAALAAMGRRISDVEAVVVTHNHFDHLGCAERVRAESGGRAYIHPADAAVARGDERPKPPPGAIGVRKDERRAEKLRQVARRIKHGSSMARRMTPVKRAVHTAPAPPPAAMSERETPRVDQLRAEARYHGQRLDLYRARLYGGRALSVARLEEFQRASARLRQAVEEAATARPQASRDPTPRSPRSASTSGSPNI